MKYYVCLGMSQQFKLNKGTWLGVQPPSLHHEAIHLHLSSRRAPLSVCPLLLSLSHPRITPSLENIIPVCLHFSILHGLPLSLCLIAQVLLYLFALKSLNHCEGKQEGRETMGCCRSHAKLWFESWFLVLLGKRIILNQYGAILFKKKKKRNFLLTCLGRDTNQFFYYDTLSLLPSSFILKLVWASLTPQSSWQTLSPFSC